MTVDPDEAIALIEAGRKATVERGGSCANWDLLELSLRFERMEGSEISRLMSHIESQHGREPGVIEALTQMLVQMGVLRPDGSPAMPPGAPEEPRNRCSRRRRRRSRQDLDTRRILRQQRRRETQTLDARNGLSGQLGCRLSCQHPTGIGRGTMLVSTFRGAKDTRGHKQQPCAVSRRRVCIQTNRGFRVGRGESDEHRFLGHVPKRVHERFGVAGCDVVRDGRVA